MLGKVSVIIPTYNRAAQIGATVAGVLAQTLPPHEIIVVDDGSTDDTLDVMRRLTATSGEAAGIRWVRQANQGKSAALNHGLQLVTGEWIAFLDSDDLWLPEKLDRQVRVLERFPECGACCTDSRYLNDPSLTVTAFERSHFRCDGDTGKIPDAAELFARGWPGIYMQSVIVRADVMRAVGEFEPRLRTCQDTDFLFRLALGTPICYVNQPLVEIDRTPMRSDGLATPSYFHSARYYRECEIMFEKWLGMEQMPRPDLVPLIRKKLRWARVMIGEYQLCDGELRDARRHLRTALKQGFATRVWLKWLLTFLPPQVVQQLLALRPRQPNQVPSP